MKSRPKRYLVSSDWHVPYHDRNHVRALLEFTRDVKPDGFVLAGDFLDFIEVSRHNAGSVALMEGKRLHRSFDAGNEVLDQIDAAAGTQCKEKYFLGGNHEHRMARWIQKGDNAIFAGDPSVDIAKRLGLDRRGYRWSMNYPKGVVKLGKLHVIHGVTCTKYSAAVHLDRFQASVMFGHTHVSSMHHGSKLGGQRGGYGLGHMADIRSEAMSYAPTPNAWVAGFAQVIVEAGGNFHVTPLNFVNGRFFYGSKMYGVSRE